MIAWYTIETNLLRAATVKNTEVSISPKFAIEYIGDNKLKVSNIGNGTALNIKFKKLIFEPNKALKAEIDPIQYLEAGRTMEAILQFNMGDSTLPFGANLDPKYLQTEQSIDICHEDILHNKISQKCTFGKKGTTIAGTS
ncbi:MAG: hypothetical protein IT573_08800 [Deltaproteobacteria bacterium]|nr:hypothetical protein [Deltaproteobacteria bacterium]